MTFCRRNHSCSSFICILLLFNVWCLVKYMYKSTAFLDMQYNLDHVFLSLFRFQWKIQFQSKVTYDLLAFRWLRNDPAVLKKAPSILRHPNIFRKIIFPEIRKFHPYLYNHWNINTWVTKVFPAHWYPKGSPWNPLMHASKGILNLPTSSLHLCFYESRCSWLCLNMLKNTQLEEYLRVWCWYRDLIKIKSWVWWLPSSGSDLVES